MFSYDHKKKRYSRSNDIDIKSNNVAKQLDKMPNDVLKFMIRELHEQVEDLQYRLNQTDSLLLMSKYLRCSQCQIYHQKNSCYCGVGYCQSCTTLVNCQNCFHKTCQNCYERYSGQCSKCTYNCEECYGPVIIKNGYDQCRICRRAFCSNCFEKSDICSDSVCRICKE